mgnify:CR=1 FL=1
MKGNNLHRNVIFRDNGDKASQVEPFIAGGRPGAPIRASCGSGWQAYEAKTGGQVLAIAHNGNLSNGMMFPLVEYFNGKPIDREYAADTRQPRAHLRSHADEGRWRSASLPFAERRVRQLRDLGQRQPRPDRGQEAGDAASSSTRARR